MTGSSDSLVEPAYLTGPEYHTTFGPEVADLGTEVGFAPDPEQRLALDHIFGVDRQGRSTAFEIAAICARQNLKTGLFKQAALGWLFITDQELVVWSAHEFSTAQEAFRDMEILIEGCSWLSRRVKRMQHKPGSEAIELRSGQRLKFKARTLTGGRGLTGDRVVLDEAFALRPDHMGALMPTLSAMPDPQILYGSSAGKLTSDVLRKVRDRGRVGSSPRLFYVEWCAPKRACEDEKCSHEVGSEGCQLDVRENVQAANPLAGRTRANGTGITWEYLDAERRALPPEEFARERLGWWEDPTAADLFGPGKWEAGAQDARPEGLKVAALAVAVSFDLRRSAIVAAAPDGEKVWVKLLHHGPLDVPTAVGRCLELQQAFGVDVVIDGRGPGAVLIPHLETAKVKLHVATTADVLDAYANLETKIRDEKFLHVTAKGLDEAAAGAVKRDVQDRATLGRKTSTSDISPLEAAQLAAWWAELARPEEPPKVHAWPSDEEIRSWEGAEA